eukprot:m.27506 g.27506  ORF g.27506 m.27506 type:complete len:361 (+) comp39781_c0_seq1:890-1972(+)
MAGRGAQLDRPVGPGQRAVLHFGRLGQQLELGDALGAVAVAGAHAVAAGIATADDDDVLAVGAQLVLQLVASVDLVLLRQEFHREVHAGEIAAGHGQVARLLGATGQHDGVELRLQVIGRDRLLGPVGDLGTLGQCSDHHAGAELDALGLHLLDAAVDVGLLHLEVRNAVAQQAADAVVLLEHRDAVADASQLLRRSQASRAGADDGNLLAGLHLGRLGRDPAFGPGAVDDGVLDGLDPHGVVIDVQRAGRLARCRADAAGELGEVVGAVQHGDRVLPVLSAALVDQVVEVWNDVVDRAAAVAERRAAVHAARALLLRLVDVQRNDEFLVVLDASDDGLVALFQTLVLHEAGDFSHVGAP